jgi:hypothetical protein
VLVEISYQQVPECPGSRLYAGVSPLSADQTMKCTSCLRNIAAGAEAQKMIVEYQQPDGTVQVRGYMMPDGPISAATGVMIAGWHSKCFWVAKKREARGDEVTGRVVAGNPTGYSIDQIALNRDDLAALGITPEQARDRSMLHLSARVTAIRDLAKQLGRAVGDAQVQEAFVAQEHGGPYTHEHHHRLEPYQLIAHLEYAHGITDQNLLGSAAGLHEHHMLIHARRRQEEIRAQRTTDEEPEPATRDWREQLTADLRQDPQA